MREFWQRKIQCKRDNDQGWGHRHGQGWRESFNYNNNDRGEGSTKHREIKIYRGIKWWKIHQIKCKRGVEN